MKTSEFRFDFLTRLFDSLISSLFFFLLNMKSMFPIFFGYNQFGVFIIFLEHVAMTMLILFCGIIISGIFV
jgi:hypothetical protein